MLRFLKDLIGLGWRDYILYTQVPDELTAEKVTDFVKSKIKESDGIRFHSEDHASFPAFPRGVVIQRIRIGCRRDEASVVGDQTKDQFPSLHVVMIRKT